MASRAVIGFFDRSHFVDSAIVSTIFADCPSQELDMGSCKVIRAAREHATSCFGWIVVDELC